MAGFSIFLFFSLAIVKRFAELENLRATDLPPKNGRGYLVSDIEQLRSFGTASAFAAVMIFAIYISGDDVIKLYHRPQLLWLIMPLMILWLCRVWLLASRGKLNEDPIVFALTDRTSLTHRRRSSPPSPARNLRIVRLDIIAITMISLISK